MSESIRWVESKHRVFESRWGLCQGIENESYPKTGIDGQIYNSYINATKNLYYTASDIRKTYAFTNLWLPKKFQCFIGIFKDQRILHAGYLETLIFEVERSQYFRFFANNAHLYEQMVKNGRSKDEGDESDQWLSQIKPIKYIAEQNLKKMLFILYLALEHLNRVPLVTIDTILDEVKIYGFVSNPYQKLRNAAGRRILSTRQKDGKIISDGWVDKCMGKGYDETSKDIIGIFSARLVERFCSSMRSIKTPDDLPEACADWIKNAEVANRQKTERTQPQLKT